MLFGCSLGLVINLNQIFSSANKIELLASILAGNNEDIIRDAGYGIPDDPVVRRWGINKLKIPGKLNLDVRPPTS